MKKIFLFILVGLILAIPLSIAGEVYLYNISDASFAKFKAPSPSNITSKNITFACNGGGIDTLVLSVHDVRNGYKDEVMAAIGSGRLCEGKAIDTVTDFNNKKLRTYNDTFYSFEETEVEAYECKSTGKQYNLISRGCKTVEALEVEL